MRDYGEYCSAARALDVIGDRWSLLIVRELEARPCRYGELLDGLPGIATNLLADRLRSLEASGIVEKDDDSAIYRLSERGEALRGVLKELVRWGIPLMVSGQGDDEFRPQWLSLALQAIYEDTDIDPPVALGVRTREGLSEMWIGPTGVRTRLGTTDDADVTVDGPADAVLAVLTGNIAFENALSRGIRVTGTVSELERLVSHFEVNQMLRTSTPKP